MNWSIKCERTNSNKVGLWSVKYALARGHWPTAWGATTCYIQWHKWNISHDLFIVGEQTIPIYLLLLVNKFSLDYRICASLLQKLFLLPALHSGEPGQGILVKIRWLSGFSYLWRIRRNSSDSDLIVLDFFDSLPNWFVCPFFLSTILPSTWLI